MWVALVPLTLFRTWASVATVVAWLCVQSRTPNQLGKFTRRRLIILVLGTRPPRAKRENRCTHCPQYCTDSNVSRESRRVLVRATGIRPGLCPASQLPSSKAASEAPASRPSGCPSRRPSFRTDAVARSACCAGRRPLKQLNGIPGMHQAFRGRKRKRPT